MNQHVPTTTITIDLSARQIDEIIKGASPQELFGEIHPPEYPDRVGNYMYTHTSLFFPCDPRPEEVNIEDIAAALSRIPRFGGNSIRFMSVAEHLWLCSQIVPREVALEALLHDGSEAYIGDMIRPLKYLPILGAVYLKIEAGIERAIADRFKLVYPWTAPVKWADEVIVGAEVYQNIRSPKSNYLTDDAIARDSGVTTQLYFWNADLAKAHFLSRFYELAKERGIS